MFTPLVAQGSLEDDLASSPDVLGVLLASVDAGDQTDIPANPAPGPCSCHSLPAGSCPAFIDRFIKVVVEVLAHDCPNMDGAKILLPGRQIDPEPWQRLLGSYFDKDELVRALLFGWDFSLLPDPKPKDAPANLASAEQHSDHISAYIKAELAHGSIVGPLPANLPFEVFRNPLGTVPKPRCPEKRRTITDCSQNGLGINTWIPHDHHRGRPVKTALPGTKDIISAIQRTKLRFPGQVVQIFKCDYSRFYRQFLSCPSQSPFLCIEWEGELYCDRSWSFGNRGACMASQRFSVAVAWFFRTQVPPLPAITNSGKDCRCNAACDCGDNECKVYIDDSIGVCAAINATWLFNCFVELVDSLTLKLSTTPGHISPPSSSCVALGVLYDTVSNTVSLPDDKLADIKVMLLAWSTKKVATPRELDSLAGRLLWCAQVVPPGRIFLGRVLALKRLADARPPALARRPVGLDKEFQRDVAWWSDMVSPWNGRSFLVPILSADVALDASSNGWEGGLPGIGAFCHANNQFLATSVPPAMHTWPIADLELLAHLLAVRAWGHLWRSHNVNILTDNESCRWLLQNGRSRDSRRLALARALVSEQFLGSFRIVSARISTSDNVLADPLSRLGQPGKWDEFREVCDSFGAVPVRVQVQSHWFQFNNDND